jgi:hypothetical protein
MCKIAVFRIEVFNPDDVNGGSLLKVDKLLYQTARSYDPEDYNLSLHRQPVGIF